MMLPVLKKVIKEEKKDRLKVLGVFKYEATNSTKTTITYEKETLVVIEGEAGHLPDDIVEDVTFDQIEDQGEV